MTLTSNPQSHFHLFFLSAAQRFKMTSTAEWVEADEAALMAMTFNDLTRLNIKIAFSGHPAVDILQCPVCWHKPVMGRSPHGRCGPSSLAESLF